MATRSEVIDRWARYGELGSVGLRGRETTSVSWTNGFMDGRKLYSYGRHFELGRFLPDRSAVILNGDRYSVTTSRHQSETLAAVNGRSLPYVLLPYSAVERAGIDIDSIRALDVRPDRWETVERSSADPREVPGQRYAEPDNYVTWDGERYRWRTSVHRLGESVISADVSHDAVIGHCDGPPETDRLSTERCEHYMLRPHDVTERRTERRFFISGFDDETAAGGPLYFLAELPGRAYSYAAALKMLRPPIVRRADRAGVSVPRQGDIFAVPDPKMTKRALRKRGATFGRRSDTTGRLGGTSHYGTEVATMPDGTQWARGFLWHRPGWNRRPEHRRIRIDGWHRIVRNTVPAIVREGETVPRAWTISGSVD